MSKKRDKSDDEALFHEQLGDAVPLNESRAEPYRRRLTPRPLNLPIGDEEESSQDHYSDHEIETGEVLYFARPGVQNRLMHDLQRGYLEIGGELDLHGLTVRYARADLDGFLKQCQERRIRCVRIIHGKGYGSEGRQAGSPFSSINSTSGCAKETMSWPSLRHPVGMAERVQPMFYCVIRIRAAAGSRSKAGR